MRIRAFTDSPSTSPALVPPLRWRFDSLEGGEGSVWWTWSAFERDGELVMKSPGNFRVFSDCVEDAQSNGYIVAPEQ